MRLVKLRCLCCCSAICGCIGAAYTSNTPDKQATTAVSAPKRCYEKAAESGNALAQTNLGLTLQRPGVPQDYAEAMKWFAWQLIKGMRPPSST